MNKIKEYLKLMRVKHYIKNFLIFLPLVFNGKFSNFNLLVEVFIAFISFSFVASIVYIINDIKDVEKDRMHDTKKNRPLAKGSVSVTEAIIIVIVLFVFSVMLLYFIGDSNCILYMFIYLVINILYSFKLKHIPIVDITILTFGFMLRVMFGGSIININVSSWLYLTVMSMAFYLSLGKRRNEIIKSKCLKTRDVLKYYTKEFLDKFMYLCLSLTIVFYSLWTVSDNNCLHSNILIWTVPLVIIICMKYSMIIEGNSDGDPVEVVFKDKLLLSFIVIYGLLMIGLFYL